MPKRNRTKRNRKRTVQGRTKAQQSIRKVVEARLQLLAEQMAVSRACRIHSLIAHGSALPGPERGETPPPTVLPKAAKVTPFSLLEDAHTDVLLLTGRVVAMVDALIGACPSDCTGDEGPQQAGVISAVARRADEIMAMTRRAQAALDRLNSVLP